MIDAFRNATAAATKGRDETIASLPADLTDEFLIAGAALPGSPGKAEVDDELPGHSVAMFVAVLRPFGGLSEGAAIRLCTGVVGVGDALSCDSGKVAETDAVATFRDMIRGS